MMKLGSWIGCLGLLATTAVFAQGIRLSEVENVEALRAILSELEQVAADQDPGIKQDLSRRRTADTVDADDSISGVISLDPGEYYNPFLDLEFSVRIATTFFWDFQDQSTGIGYQVIPSLRFRFGTTYTKNLNYNSSQAVNGWISVEDFRIAGHWDNSTLAIVDNNGEIIPINQAYFYPESNYLIPVLTFGDIDAGINFYGGYFQFSSTGSIKLGEDVPYSVRIHTFDPNRRYGAITSDFFLNDFGGEDQNGYRSQIGEGPQMTIGYQWKGNLFTELRLVFPTLFTMRPNISFDGGNFDFIEDLDSIPEELKNRYSLRYQIGLKSSNEWVPDFEVTLGYIMGIGGGGGLGGADANSNFPASVSADIGYRYSLWGDLFYIQPFVGTVLGFKTSTNPGERELSSRTYVAMRLGWAVDHYDDGTPYYQVDNTYDVDSLFLEGNPIFSREEFHGGLTASFSYTEEPWLVVDPYFNFRLSLYEDTRGGLIPGLGFQLSYEAGQLRVNQDTGKHALAVYIDYYIFHNIRMYVGNLTLFESSQDYLYTQTFGTELPQVLIASADAQSYVKVGFLFEEVFPYTSFLVQYSSNDLVGGFVPADGGPLQRAGVLTLTALARF